MSASANTALRESARPPRAAAAPPAAWQDSLALSCTAAMGPVSASGSPPLLTKCHTAINCPTFGVCARRSSWPGRYGCHNDDATQVTMLNVGPPLATGTPLDLIVEVCDDSPLSGAPPCEGARQLAVQPVGELHSRTHAHLRVDVADVELDRLDADGHLRGDVAVAHAGGDPGSDRQLLAGQAARIEVASLARGQPAACSSTSQRSTKGRARRAAKRSRAASRRLIAARRWPRRRSICP